MISAFPSLTTSARRFFTTKVSRSVFVLAAALALSSSLSAQNTAPADDAQGRGNRGNRGNRGQGGGGNFDPAQFQQQAMDRMREQFGVTDDAEWKLISDRITAITELRAAGGRGGGLAAFAGRGGGGGPGGQGGGQGGGGGRGGRGGFGANPEQDALRQAITDKLPDAEIKARLARLREVRKANEEKLTKAQEDLRALLDVKQEAVAVMAGLLP